MFARFLKLEIDQMRRLACVLFLCVGVVGAYAQSVEKAEGDSVPWEIRKQAFIYNSARLFNDAQVVKMSLYNMLAENPNNSALYDSLALIYYQYSQFASSALVSEQSLRVNPNNLFAAEIAGSSFDQLGVKDKAIPYYEKLYLANNDLGTLYKIGFLQLEVGRFAEADTSADILIGDSKAEESTIGFPTEDGQRQEVSLKIAAHRLKAMILERKGERESALKAYLEVLEMSPGLQIVQSQIQVLNKQEE